MSNGNSRVCTASQVRDIVGPLDDSSVAAIVATGATPAEVTEAFTWVNADDVLGPDPEHGLSGRIIRVYEILTDHLPPAEGE